MDKKDRIIAILSLIIMVMFIRGVYYLSTANVIDKGAPTEKEDTLPSEFNPRITVSFPTEATAIKGIVAKIEGNTIILHITSLSPLSDSELNERIVLVDENTKILEEGEQKDLKVYAQEIEEFERKIAEIGEQPNAEELLRDRNLIYPGLKVIREVNFDAIHVSQLIIVMTEENIFNKKQFTANEILIQDYIAPPQ